MKGGNNRSSTNSRNSLPQSLLTAAVARSVLVGNTNSTHNQTHGGSSDVMVTGAGNHSLVAQKPELYHKGPKVDDGRFNRRGNGKKNRAAQHKPSATSKHSDAHSQNTNVTKSSAKKHSLHNEARSRTAREVAHARSIALNTTTNSSGLLKRRQNPIVLDFATELRNRMKLNNVTEVPKTQAEWDRLFPEGHEVKIFSDAVNGTPTMKDYRKHDYEVDVNFVGEFEDMNTTKILEYQSAAIGSSISYDPVSYSERRNVSSFIDAILLNRRDAKDNLEIESKDDLVFTREGPNNKVLIPSGFLTAVLNFDDSRVLNSAIGLNETILGKGKTNGCPVMILANNSTIDSSDMIGYRVTVNASDLNNTTVFSKHLQLFDSISNGRLKSFSVEDGSGLGSAIEIHNSDISALSHSGELVIASIRDGSNVGELSIESGNYNPGSLEIDKSSVGRVSGSNLERVKISDIGRNNSQIELDVGIQNLNIKRVEDGKIKVSVPSSIQELDIDSGTVLSTNGLIQPKNLIAKNVTGELKLEVPDNIEIKDIKAGALQFHQPNSNATVSKNVALDNASFRHFDKNGKEVPLPCEEATIKHLPRSEGLTTSLSVAKLASIPTTDAMNITSSSPDRFVMNGSVELVVAPKTEVLLDLHNKIINVPDLNCILEISSDYQWRQMPFNSTKGKLGVQNLFIDTHQADDTRSILDKNPALDLKTKHLIIFDIEGGVINFKDIVSPNHKLSIVFTYGYGDNELFFKPENISGKTKDLFVGGSSQHTVVLDSKESFDFLGLSSVKLFVDKIGGPLVENVKADTLYLNYDMDTNLHHHSSDSGSRGSENVVFSPSDNATAPLLIFWNGGDNWINHAGSYRNVLTKFDANKDRKVSNILTSVLPAGQEFDNYCAISQAPSHGEDADKCRLIMNGNHIKNLVLADSNEASSPMGFSIISNHPQPSRVENLVLRSGVEVDIDPGIAVDNIVAYTDASRVFHETLVNHGGVLRNVTMTHDVSSDILHQIEPGMTLAEHGVRITDAHNSLPDLDYSTSSRIRDSDVDYLMSKETRSISDDFRDKMLHQQTEQWWTKEVSTTKSDEHVSTRSNNEHSENAIIANTTVHNSSGDRNAEYFGYGAVAGAVATAGIAAGALAAYKNKGSIRKAASRMFKRNDRAGVGGVEMLEHGQDSRESLFRPYSPLAAENPIYRPSNKKGDGRSHASLEAAYQEVPLTDSGFNPEASDHQASSVATSEWVSFTDSESKRKGSKKERIGLDKESIL